MIGRLILGDPARAVDVNDSRTLFAAMLMAVIGPEVFIVQPGFVQGLVGLLGFSERQAGYIASAEMWGIAATTVAMSVLAARVNWRRAFAWSLALVIAGNLVSMGVRGFEAFAAIRFAVGLGSGGLVSLSFAVVGLTARPDRNFGWLIMWVLTYGALALLAMPTVYALAGMNALLVFFAAFAALGLPFVRFLPICGDGQLQVEADAVDLAPGLKRVALAAMLSYFLAQGVVWAYLFLIGTGGGATEQQVANGLTASQFFGIAGAFTAAMIGARFGRAGPLTLGIVAGIVPLAFLFGETAAIAYALAVCVYNYGWNLTHPYLLAAMASFDRGGRLVVHAVAMQMLGLAIGPALAATVIGARGYANVLWLGMGLFALCLALILPPVLVQTRLSSRAMARVPT